MANVLQSQYNCRLNNIDIMYKQILNQKFYKLTAYQLNIIRTNFPSKNIPEFIDLTNINDIWLLLGCNVRLYLHDFLQIKNNMKNLKKIILDTALLLQDILKLTVEQENILINNNILEVLNSCYITLLEYNEKCYIIVDEILRLVNMYRNFYTYPDNINTLNNDYKKIVNNDWFYTIFYIYEKYGGKYPTTCNNLFELLKLKYTDMVDLHANEITSIIDTYLGGLSVKNIFDISKNFESWIRRNYDCVGNFITNKIQFVNVVEVF